MRQLKTRPFSLVLVLLAVITVLAIGATAATAATLRPDPIIKWVIEPDPVIHWGLAPFSRIRAIGRPGPIVRFGLPNTSSQRNPVIRWGRLKASAVAATAPAARRDITQRSRCVSVQRVRRSE